MFSTQTKPTPPPFVSSLIGWTLLKEIRLHPEFKRCGMPYWQLYRNFIKHILVKISQQNQKGQIIWLPERMSCGQKTDIDAQHTSLNDPEAVPLFATLHRLEKPPLACKQQILDHADRLQQMARKGGTLVLSSRLRSLYHGAVLKAQPWRQQVIFAADESSCEPGSTHAAIDSSHSPAINFVGAHPGSVAFITDQNRPIIALTNKDPQTVYCWMDCLGKHPSWTIGA